MSVESLATPRLHEQIFPTLNAAGEPPVEPSDAQSKFDLDDQNFSSAKSVPFQKSLSKEAPLEDKLQACKDILIPYDADDVASYLSAIGRVPLLNAQDEIELGRRIEVGLMADHTLKLLPEEKLASEAEADEEYIKDLNFIKTEGQQAESLFIQANLRLVVSIAKRYHGPLHMKQLDLIQEGNLGLIHALRKFDYTKGYKFSTYASNWIAQAIVRSITNQDKAIHVPAEIQTDLQKLEAHKDTLRHQLGRAPTEQELAEKIGKNVDRVRWLQRAGKLQPTSLDATVSGTDDLTLAEVTPHPTDSSLWLEKLLQSQNDEQQLGKILLSLNERDQKLIATLFGLENGCTPSLKEIANEFGVSKQRVSQLKRSILKKLCNHHAPHRKNLTKQ